MRTTIHAALRPADIPRINFAALVAAAADAVARGWTGDELARIAVEGVYTGDVRDVGAVMVSNLRAVAGIDPIRTPTPVAMSEHQKARAQAIRDAAGVDHGGWVERVKAQHAARRRENAR